MNAKKKEKTKASTPSSLLCKLDTMNRIVIPKPVRQILHIQAGNQVEIQMCGSDIRLMKVHQPSNLPELAKEYIETVYKLCDCPAAICNNEKLLAVTPELARLKDQAISDALRISQADGVSYAEPLRLTKLKTNWYVQSFEVITQDNMILGAVILAYDTAPKELPPHILQSVQAMAALIGKLAK